ncbi:MAG: 3-dehydroquinate synthase [Flavobacteriales bacterium]|nr:3-dehydroquinate synthase [Flavobacteriales bacterium]
MSPVYFKEQGWRFLHDLLATEKAIILCDSNTKQCLEYLNVACPKTVDLPVIEMPAGERNKTLKICEMVWYQLTDHGADRNTVLLNVGGGVVTDLGGFVASTFMRGIRLVNIPTSLLGMVDAAIGGKTGIDFGGLKNMVGTFSQPETVLIDSNFLKTLASRHYRNGLAEVLKHAFISDSSILDLMEANEDELISRSVQVKMDVVLRDEFEAGERKKLNFGHTIGHAIESHLLDSEQAVLHGEAIAAGMIMESWLSQKIVGLSEAELNSICVAVDSVFSRIAISESDWEAIKKLLVYDKKNRDGQVQFVLIKSIGTAIIDQPVSETLLDEAWKFYLNQA